MFDNIIVILYINTKCKNIGSYGYSKTFSITNNYDIDRIPACNLTVIRKDNKSGII